jgi:hypothetical protein
MGKIIITTFGYALALSLVFCVHLVLRKHRALRGAEQCQGSVIAHVRRTGGRGGPSYALKIGYRDKQSISHDFTTRNASNPPSRAVGAKVTVFHYPDGSAPDVLVFEDLYLWYWIWFCLGAFALGCLVAPRVLNILYLRRP